VTNNNRSEISQRSEISLDTGLQERILLNNQRIEKAHNVRK